MFRRYVPRIEAFEREPALVYGTATTDALIVFVCGFLGVWLLASVRQKHKLDPTEMNSAYLPLGLFFVFLSLAHVSLLISIWHAYYWINLIFKGCAGGTALWFCSLLKGAIEEHRANRAAIKALREKIITLERIKDELSSAG